MDMLRGKGYGTVGPATPVVRLVIEDISLRRRLGRLFAGEGWPVAEVADPDALPGCDVLVVDCARLSDVRVSVPTVVVVRGADEQRDESVSADVRAIVDRDDLDCALLAAVREAYEGHGWISPTLVRSVLRRTSRRVGGAGAATSEGATVNSGDAAGATVLNIPGGEGLTPRETEVIGWVRQGLSNSEIAASLQVEESTVKFHVSNILRKTGSRDRAQLLANLFPMNTVGRYGTEQRSTA